LQYSNDLSKTHTKLSSPPSIDGRNTTMLGLRYLFLACVLVLEANGLQERDSVTASPNNGWNILPPPRDHYARASGIEPSAPKSRREPPPPPRPPAHKPKDPKHGAPAPPPHPPGHKPKAPKHGSPKPPPPPPPPGHKSKDPKHGVSPPPPAPKPKNPKHGAPKPPPPPPAPKPNGH